MRLQRISLVAAGILATVTGCTEAAADDFGQPTGSTTAHARDLLPMTSTSSGDAPRDLLIRDIEQTYPTNSYYGVSADGGVLLIHRGRVPLVDDLDAGLRLRHPEVPLIFTDAPPPHPVLTELTTHIKVDIPYWKSKGVAVAAVALNHDGSGVAVMVDQPTAALAAAMRERYKFPNLELFHGEFAAA